MDIGIVSSRYAHALLKFATLRNEAQDVYRAMVHLGDSFQQMPALYDSLLNPVVPNQKKIHLLNVAIGNRPQETLQKFFVLVLKKKRIALMPFMVQSYIKAYREKNGLIYSRLTVPTAISHSLIERLKLLIQKQYKKTPEFVIEENPSIIGGFILEYDTFRMDASVQGQLQKIRKQLIENRT